MTLLFTEGFDPVISTSAAEYNGAKVHFSHNLTNKTVRIEVQKIGSAVESVEIPTAQYVEMAKCGMSHLDIFNALKDYSNQVAGAVTSTIYECPIDEYKHFLSAKYTPIEFAKVVFNDDGHDKYLFSFYDKNKMIVPESKASFVRVEKILTKAKSMLQNATFIGWGKKTWVDQPWEVDHSKMTLSVEEAYKLAKLTLTNDEMPEGYQPWCLVIGDQKLPAPVPGLTRVFFEDSPLDECKFIGTCKLPVVQSHMTKIALVKPNQASFQKTTEWGFTTSKFYVPVKWVYRPALLAKVIGQPQCEMVVLTNHTEAGILNELPEWTDWRPWIEATKGDI